MISRYLENAARRKGLPPGSVMLMSDERYRKTLIKSINYGENFCEEKTHENIVDAFERPKDTLVSWINIDGLHDSSVITKIGEKFNIHPLILEDILSIDSRPKMEEYYDFLLIILRMIKFDEKEYMINAEQISMIVMKDTLISFQEVEGDVFNMIRDRIRTNKGKIRKTGADYLAYSLIDAMVDGYFVVLDKIGEEIEEIEENLVENFSNKNQDALIDIHELKREMIFLRRSVWPLREILSGLHRAHSAFIADSTMIYFKDSYDHTVQVVDTIDTYREMLSSMHDVYLSSISNKMNEIMKVLTIISTIFIPLTFISGIYGMNFHTDASPFNMPELSWKYGYFACLGLMLAIVFTMLIFFRKNKWI
jgi:magnesium transporter